MRSASLSISSTSSKSSISSSRDLSPHASPRRALLSTSPPLSPSLPSLIHRHGRASSKTRRKPVPLCSTRVAVSIFAVVILTLVLIRGFISEYNDSKKVNYDLVDQGHLPDDAAAIIVDDSHQKWTVWIPPRSDFPLRPWQYAEICAQAEQIQLELNGGSSLFGKKKHPYYAEDPSYLEVSEAVESGTIHGDHLNDTIIINDLMPKEVCQKSMTYVMETEDAGMGNTLLALWLAYGLAKKEGRAFFVDDSRWPYGKYSTYFRPPPSPGCRSPPDNHRVPCPRQAAHLVVSAATFPWAFGPSFKSEFLDISRPSHEQHHKIYDLMRRGYEDLFHLADAGDAAYAQDRTTGKIFQEAHHGGGMTIGLHVRRGDVHPWEREFESDYLPIMRYMDEVRQILFDTYEHEEEEDEQHSSASSSIAAQPASSTHKSKATKHSMFTHLSPFSTFTKTLNTDLRRRHGPAGLMASSLLLSSDDPAVYAAPEVSRAIRAQDRILLATKTDLEHMSGASLHRGPIDSLHGWEGGFYASAFWALGAPDRRTASPPARQHLRGRAVESEVHEKFAAALQAASASLPPHDPWHGGVKRSVVPASTPEALAMRAVLGRGYLLDLAVLGKTDAVVCAVSSAACRVLGVMIGWDKVAGGKWVNVDGKFGWRGLVIE
ncbi:hypothetical protein BT63DRAFT_416323 [Microthyrium microscopicum]|uniref:Uncharacterized protein n=1 Tax=Microthyrium microscopicum TaxID=703497 RepID=A0A6A6U4K7_9PEZI|nr:hypothetical protein BT63DRAFT_416323 [Microthyrium microscopicum]